MFCLLLIICVVVFLYATIFDFQISLRIADLSFGQYYSTNSFAVFFEIFGESVLYVMLSLSLAVIFHYIKFNKKNFFKVFYNLITFCALFFVNYLFITRTYKYLEKYLFFEINNLKIIFFIIFAIVFAVFYIFLLKNLKENKINKLFYFALLVIFVAFFSTLLIYILKNKVVLRMRFRAMNFLNDASFFTPWWKVNGENIKNLFQNFYYLQDAFKSFPSGHTAAAGLSLCFVFYPYFVNKKMKHSKRISYILWPIILTLTVGFSRIVAGAHFLTDVLFAILIDMFFISLFFYFILLIKRRTKKSKIIKNLDK